MRVWRSLELVVWRDPRGRRTFKLSKLSLGPPVAVFLAFSSSALHLSFWTASRLDPSTLILECF